MAKIGQRTRLVSAVYVPRRFLARNGRWKSEAVSLEAIGVTYQPGGTMVDVIVRESGRHRLVRVSRRGWYFRAFARDGARIPDAAFDAWD